MLTLLTGWLVKAVLPSIGTVVGGYLVALLQKQLQRVKIQLTQEQEHQIRDAIQNIVRGIEEKAVTQPLSSEQKRAEAVAATMALNPQLTDGDANELVHQELTKVRPPTPLPQRFGAR